MPAKTRIRPEMSSDAPRIRAVNTAAFETDAEANLVDQLRQCDAFVPELSLVAVIDDQVVGHLLLTRATVIAETETFPVLALAPMAVLPEMQQCGIGSQLLRRSIAEAAALGHSLIVVLGHAAYYPRFGFVPASSYGSTSPFPAPDEAFMALWLEGSTPRMLNGRLCYASPFEDLS